MLKDTPKVPTLTIGLDIGDKYIHHCSIDAEGGVQESGRIATNRDVVETRFSAMAPCRIVLEAGSHSPWISRLLEGIGHEVYVANPRKVQLISESSLKNDQVDAETLARLGRLDPGLLSPITHRSASCQVDLQLMTCRDKLVGTRSSLICLVRGCLKSFAIKCPSISASAFHKKAMELVPEEQMPALKPILEVIQDLTKRIRAYDKEIEHLVTTKHTDAMKLTAVNGVGDLTALAFVLVLGNPHRFKNSRAVGSYLGLRPRMHMSGYRNPQLRITKAGNDFLRKLLVQAAQYILGPFGKDCDLRRWGLAIAERGGRNQKKRAIIAVARKLACLLHHLWVIQDDYVPLRNPGRDTADPVEPSLAGGPHPSTAAA